MSDHHYQLQAVLYLVALHRYLRSRLGSTYDYDTHVAGAAYLYIRGMRAEVPGAGVMHLKPSAACITALSDLFDGAHHE
jgi:exodeoxyribonuclease V beta subunit